MNKNVAIILAGGSGNRFGESIPKQFTKLAGKTIIEHTLDAFQTHQLIDEICVVSKIEWISKVEELVAKNKYNKVKKIISGGKERKDSSLNAIKAYTANENYNLIFHDAVRPFVNARIIEDVIESLSHYNAVGVAINATDTIVQVDDKIITEIPNRDKMFQIQTPQAFRLKTIKNAYALASKDSNFKPTDDCGIVKKYLPKEQIYIADGSIENIKITHKQDLIIADEICRK